MTPTNYLPPTTATQLSTELAGVATEFLAERAARHDATVAEIRIALNSAGENLLAVATTPRAPRKRTPSIKTSSPA